MLAGVVVSGLLLLTISTGLAEKESTSNNNTFRPFEPTREELYKQFAQELQVVAGAEEHAKEVYHSAIINMRQLVSHAILDKLQALMDSIGSCVEDILDNEENEVTLACTSGKDVEAEKVVKDTLDDMKQCVDNFSYEGEELAQRAASVITHVEAVLKKLVTAVEECLSSSTDSSVEEKEQVKKCLISDSVKKLISEKQDAYKPLEAVMKKVFDTEKQPPDCISELFQKAENKILEMKETITNCAQQNERDEL